MTGHLTANNDLRGHVHSGGEARTFTHDRRIDERGSGKSSVAVVVVTGCSSGFGLASAIAFARDGDRVYATMRNVTKTSLLEAEAAKEGVSLIVRELDVTSDLSVQRAIAAILRDERRIDVLVNNAGVARTGPVELLPDHLVRETFETNLFGSLRMIRAVLPTMRQQRTGVIINISSVAGRLWGKPITWAYDASKHALGVLSDGLALELEQFGIRVRVIEPGFFATNMLDNSVHFRGEDSPYSQIETSVWDHFVHSVVNAPDNRQVADAVVRAAQARQPWPVHTPVGADAEALISSLYTMSEQDWVSRIKQSLEL
jgi:NAD(P)-dependent dehydrogenase (short-subunit alcohol dehydrogenase family)